LEKYYIEIGEHLENRLPHATKMSRKSVDEKESPTLASYNKVPDPNNLLKKAEKN